MYSRYCKLRDERGVNDLQVATATKIPASTLYDWGQRAEKKSDAKMGVNYLKALADYFNVNIEYFLED